LNILACNTHLHFDPLHEPVKILQALLCIRCIASLIAHRVGGLNPQVIFAGDFNCHPLNAAIRMFQGEQIQLYPQNKSETFIQRLLAYLQRNNWLPGKLNQGLIIQGICIIDTYNPLTIIIILRATKLSMSQRIS
jgi:hypothetical protein